MKYSKDDYETYCFGEDDDCGISNHEQKLVKTRKEHLCVDCQKLKPPKTMMVVEKATSVDDGRISCYHCIRCVDRLLKDSGYDE